jgi:hypothetical protein
MNTLLEENLYAPMADWLHDHDMKHVTIATWGRENLLDQTSNYGDYPRMMKHFDIPGNEDSKESGPLGAFIDTKLSSSMAHLNGTNRTAVCAYWGMGWGFTQEENIARTNANYALGINLYNTHGGLYSMLAGRNEWVSARTRLATALAAPVRSAVKKVPSASAVKRPVLSSKRATVEAMVGKRNRNGFSG